MDSKIQRLRTERSPTPATPRTASAAQPSPPKTGRGIMDIRIGEPAVFAGDEKSWGDRRFKLPFYVSVVGLPLGNMMEQAELAAHANAWQPCTPVSQDMDVQLRCLFVMLTSGPALQIIRQQACGLQAVRDLARRYSGHEKYYPCSLSGCPLPVSDGRQTNGVVPLRFFVAANSMGLTWPYNVCREERIIISRLTPVLGSDASPPNWLVFFINKLPE